MATILSSTDSFIEQADPSTPLSRVTVTIDVSEEDSLYNMGDVGMALVAGLVEQALSKAAVTTVNISLSLS